MEVCGYNFESEIRLIDYYLSSGIVLNDDLYDFGLIDFYSLTSCQPNSFKNKVMNYDARELKTIISKKNVIDFLNKYENCRDLSFESAMFFIRDLATKGECSLSEEDVKYLFNSLDDNYIPVNNFTFSEAIVRYINNLELVPFNVEEDVSTIKQKIVL